MCLFLERSDELKIKNEKIEYSKINSFVLQSIEIDYDS